MRTSTYLVTGVIAPTAVLGAACSELQPEPTPTPAPTVTPTPTPSPTPAPKPILVSAEELFNASTAAMLDVDSLHFDTDALLNLEVQQGVTLEIPASVTGDFQSPDRVKGSLSLTLAFITIQSQFIGIGNTIYMTHPETGEWLVFTGGSSFIQNPRDLIGVQASRLKDLTLVGEEELDGARLYHLKATALAGTFRGTVGEFEVSFWIGIDDGLLAKVAVEGELDFGEDDPFFGGILTGTGTLTLTANFSDFGKSVSIEPPEVEPAPTPSAHVKPPAQLETLHKLALAHGIEDSLRLLSQVSRAI